MNENIKISNNGVSLLTQFEGFVSKPYVDPGSGGEPITIGIGSTTYCNGTKVTLKDTPITKEKAQEMLMCYVNQNVIPCIKKAVKVELNQNQIDALCCLCYNIGCPSFTKSSVVRFINIQHTKENIVDSFNMWVKAAGKVLPGLVKRRAVEAKLFFS